MPKNKGWVKELVEIYKKTCNNESDKVTFDDVVHELMANYSFSQAQAEVMAMQLLSTSELMSLSGSQSDMIDELPCVKDAFDKIQREKGCRKVN